MMPSRAKLSVCDKLLLAAFRLGKDGSLPFSAEDLVVAAWREFPNTFGLSGHNDSNDVPLYPDSNRVFAEIMGSKPIRQRGLLVKVGEKMYKLTGTGRDLAARLDAAAVEGGESNIGDAKATLPRSIMVTLKKLLSSRAVQKYAKGQVSELTFHDACLFWGITPQSSAIEMVGKRKDLEGQIEAARRYLQGGPMRFQHGGDVLSSETLDMLEGTHKALLARHATEILTIMGRTDQRKV
jgi:hypothetical protein